MKGSAALAVALFVLLMLSPVTKAACHKKKKRTKITIPRVMSPSPPPTPVPPPADPPIVTSPSLSSPPSFPPVPVPPPADPPLVTSPSLSSPPNFPPTPVPSQADLPLLTAPSLSSPPPPPPSSEVPPYDPSYSYGVPAAPSPTFPIVPEGSHVFVSSCDGVDCESLCQTYFYSDSNGCITYKGYHYCDCP